MVQVAKVMIVGSSCGVGVDFSGRELTQQREAVDFFSKSNNCWRAGIDLRNKKISGRCAQWLKWDFFIPRNEWRKLWSRLTKSNASHLFPFILYSNISHCFLIVIIFHIPDPDVIVWISQTHTTHYCLAFRIWAFFFFLWVWLIKITPSLSPRPTCAKQPLLLTWYGDKTANN